MNKKGFTLLELLVVVLIIGILAGIALPQYKKSIWRARAKNMLPVLRSMQTSIDVYYMVNGVYPTKFDELDINIEGYTKSCSSFGPVYQTGGCKANDYLNLIVNTGKNPGKAANPLFQFNEGPYKAAGFILRADSDMSCYENRLYVSEPKAFCEKVMGCTSNSNLSNSIDLYYSCPDL